MLSCYIFMLLFLKSFGNLIHMQGNIQNNEKVKFIYKYTQ